MLNECAWFWSNSLCLTSIFSTRSKYADGKKPPPPGGVSWGRGILCVVVSSPRTNPPLKNNPNFSKILGLFFREVLFVRINGFEPTKQWNPLGGGSSFDQSYRLTGFISSSIWNSSFSQNLDPSGELIVRTHHPTVGFHCWVTLFLTL